MSEEELMSAVVAWYEQDGGNAQDIYDLQTLMQNYMLDDEQYERCLRFFEWVAGVAGQVSGE